MEILSMLGLPIMMAAAYFGVNSKWSNKLYALLAALGTGIVLTLAGAILKTHTTDSGLLDLLTIAGSLSWVLIGYALVLAIFGFLIYGIATEDSPERWGYTGIFIAMLILGWLGWDSLIDADWTELPLYLLGLQGTVLLIVLGIYMAKAAFSGWVRFLVSTAALILASVVLAWIFHSDASYDGMTPTEGFLFDVLLVAFLIELAVGALVAVSGIATFIASRFSKEIDAKTATFRSYCSRIFGCCLIYGIPTVIVLFFMSFAILLTPSIRTPDSVEFHNAHDLLKATNVEFPEVVPVDSIYEDEFRSDRTTVKFVPKRPLTKKFFRRLDRACKEDPCWEKNPYGVEGYLYRIHIDVPEGGYGAFDRTKGMSQKMYDWDGDGKKETPYWQGNYISVEVPRKGDTITVEYGWTN
jgi:hypothetical protein